MSIYCLGKIAFLVELQSLCSTNLKKLGTKYNITLQQQTFIQCVLCFKSNKNILQNLVNIRYDQYQHSLSAL